MRGAKLLILSLALFMIGFLLHLSSYEYQKWNMGNTMGFILVLAAVPVMLLALLNMDANHFSSTNAF